jgi:hypothetical protein
MGANCPRPLGCGEEKKKRMETVENIHGTHSASHVTKSKVLACSIQTRTHACVCACIYLGYRGGITDPTRGPAEVGPKGTWRPLTKVSPSKDLS